MSSKKQEEIREVITKNRPDYASLFGSVELCDCEHCRSVYSPAAYLVDLLQFLDSKIPAVTPLDVLIGNDDKKWPDGTKIIARRPDLAHVQLSCENTNTTLPYVDLVNEVLESYIAFDQTLPFKTDAAGEPLAPAVPLPNESSSGVTAAELAANPENTRDKAYEKLEAAVYPFTLPFNQPITALRLTLEQMGSSRHEVMKVFRRTDGSEAEEDAKQCALDVEALQLTEREFAILTGERFDGTAPIWPKLDWDVSDFYGLGPPVDTPWVAGRLPEDAVQHADNDAWVFAAAAPPPASGAMAHASRVAPGLHQHFFDGVVKEKAQLKIGPEDFMYAEILLDPANLPQQVMLQWYDGTWSHRAYWGQSKITWGVEGTPSRRYMGPLPAAGEWVRLEVPVDLIGLADKQISGMAFTLFDGGATWGASGKRSPSCAERLVRVPNVLARTGISYVELIELVRTRYFNPALPQVEALAFFQRIPFGFSRLADLIKSNFPETDAPMLKALDNAKITVDELRTWAKKNFESISKMIVLDAPESACDLTVTRLQHLDGTLLDDAELSRLHRFIRLWRKLGWSIADTNRAIVALRVPDKPPALLRRLGQVVQLQTALKLSPQHLLSFSSAIPTAGDDALYRKLFLNKAVRDIDSKFEAKDGEYLRSDPSDPEEPELRIEKHLPALLAGLRTRAADLRLIRDHTSLEGDAAPLTLATVTVLFRYVTLARALKMAVKDLIDLEALSGERPFSTLSDSKDGFKDIESARMLDFVRLVGRVKESGFTPASLIYLFRKLEDASSNLAPSDESIALLLATIREGLVRIAADNAPVDDPTGEVTRAKLGLLFEAHMVEQIAGLVSGTQIYFAPLPVLPAAAQALIRVLPATSPSGKVAYDGKNRLLRAEGWLTDADLATLLPLADVDEYKKAVQSLYDQPRNMIAQTLVKQLRWDTVAKDLAISVLEVNSFDAAGNPQPQVVAGKFKFILHSALPYLRTALSRAFVKQTLADSLQLETATAALLLEGADGVVPLGTDADKALPAIADFLALTGDGLTATYFENETLAGSGQEPRVDPAIDFRWDPKHGFSVRWQGKLLADKTQRYQFHLRAGGGVRLTVDGKLRIDRWHDTAPAEHTEAVDLEAGKLYDLELEYFNRKSAAEDEPPALVELRWSGPATPAEIVPSYRFYSTERGDVAKAAQHTYIRLYKASLLVNGFKLAPRELAYLARPTESVGLDLNELPAVDELATPQALFSSWTYWFDFSALRATARRDPSRLVDVFSASTEESALDALLRATGWEENTLKTLVGDQGFKLGVADYKEAESLLKLADAMRLLSLLGAPAAEVFGWAEPLSNSSRTVLDAVTNTDTTLSSVTAAFSTKDVGRRVKGDGIPADTTIASVLSETSVTLSKPTTATASGVRINIYGDNEQARTAAQEAKRAHKAQYDNDAWLEIARPIADRLRESQRAALVAYLLPRLGYTDPVQLFEHFLIDVEMSPCMQTSRIKQAISSVQLFIQYCRMNLVRGISPKMIDAAHWKWMQNYRVWEANLKVFLHPENWTESEWRDDKTPFFRELESELLQAEVTNETAEIALGNYLEKLETVSNLKICGLHEQSNFAPNEKRQSVRHVFGRTFATPTIFYYRQLITVNPNYRYWTPWEKVPLDIQADEVLPVIWGRRLYVFWEVPFEKGRIKQKEGKEDEFTGEKLLMRRLAWAEYRNGKWSAKRVTSADQAVPVSDKSTQLTARVSGDLLTVDIWDHNKGFVEGINQASYSEDVMRARFTRIRRAGLRFTGYNGLVAPVAVGEVSITDKVGFVALVGTEWEFESRDQEKLPVFRRLSASIIHFSGSGPNPYTLNDPFFIQEGSRAYLVLPSSSLQSDLERRLTTESQPYLAGKKATGAAATAKESGVTLQASFTQSSTKANPWQSGRASVAATEMRAFSAPDSTLLSGISIASETFKYGVIKPGDQVSPRYPAEFRFETFFHPYTAEFQRRLNRYGVPGLLNLESQKAASLPKVTSFKDAYDPDGRTVKPPLPVHDVDFSFTGAYSQYNWELFFHIPLLLATRLSQNQRFEEAMRWFHFIFDPTAYSPGDTTTKRYWNVLPLRETPPQRLDDMLKALHAGDQNVIAQWEALQEHPFQPHRIARLRRIAYQKTVVMKYIDNLIAWADQLFRRDTIEAINQATQLYVLATALLGPRVQRVPPRGRSAPKTYDQLRRGLDKSNQAMVSFENDLPFSNRATGGERSTETTGLLGIGRTFYFCLPKNDRLLGYWDTVADRLFKIRHCMNIEGVVRELPLFEPPIDPALLVRAAAQGIDLNSVLNDLSAPLPYYRFSTLLAKALELTGELRSLGAALLAALEKRDAEHLANLRASHETELLSLVKQVKQQQLAEAQTAEAALQKSREVTQTRFDFYNNVQQRISEETNQLNELAQAQAFQTQSQLAELEAAELTASTADISVGVGAGMYGTGPTFSETIGRGNLIAVLQAKSRGKSLQASVHSYYANLSSIDGGWKRRADDWRLQKDLAAKELAQIDKQITAASIRVAIAQQELDNTTRQIEQSQEIQEFLRNKFTGEELYNWMVGDISTIFFQCYQMTYDLAKQAERGCRFELGLVTSNFVQFGAWDSLRKGLLCGERLYLQLKQMERAYLNGNRREYELTKHYSLVLNDPLALISLKARGWCEIELPEALFDADYPGHYMRRIKSVSLTIPAVVGPYTGVNCTLTLLRDKTRVKSTPLDGYAERDSEDDRFVTNWARMQVIATSSGQNDNGLFELNFRDERYLPFEGAGVMSRWRIELDPDSNAFDFNTLSDVVLHIRYTAREGGERLKSAAKTALADAIGAEAIKPPARLFSLKHEFPTEWHQFTRKAAAAEGTFPLTKERFPFLFRAKTLTAGKVSLYAVLREGAAPALPLAVRLTPPNGAEKALELEARPNWRGILASKESPDVAKEIMTTPDTAKWLLKTDPGELAKNVDDLLLVCEYTVN